MSESMIYEINWFRLNSSWTCRNNQMITTPSVERAKKTIEVVGIPEDAVIDSAVLTVHCTSGLGGPQQLSVNGNNLQGNRTNTVSMTVTGNGPIELEFVFQDYGRDNMSDGRHYGEMVFSEIVLTVTYTGAPPSEDPDDPDTGLPKNESTGICLYAPDAVDFTDNGIGILRPLTCVVSEEAGGQYELTLEMAIDGPMWEHITTEGIIKAPVPVIHTDAFQMSGAEYWKIKATASNVPVKSRVPTITRTDDTGQYAEWEHAGRYHRGDKVAWQGKVWQYTGVDFPDGAKTTAPGTSGYWVDVTTYSTKYNDGKTLATLQRNEVFTKIDDAGSSWMRVKTGGGIEGYIESRYAEYYDDADSYVPARTIRSQCFRIYRIEKDSQTRTVKVSARHLSYDFERTFLAQCSQQGVTVPTALSIIRSAMTIDDNRQLITNITEETVDLDCSWDNGITALLNPDTGIAAQLQAKVLRDNEDFFILQDDHTDHNFTIRYSKNMRSVRWTIDTSSMATRIIPHCKAADDTDLLLPEQYVDSPLINEYPIIYTEALSINAKVGEKGTVGGQEIEHLTEEQCCQLMREEAQKRYDEDHADEPEITVDVDLVMLGSTEEYAEYRDAEILYMYDTVRVIHPGLGIDARCFLTGYEFDAIHKHYTRLTLTNARRQQMSATAGYELKNNSIRFEKLSQTAVDRLRA